VGEVLLGKLLDVVAEPIEPWLSCLPQGSGPPGQFHPIEELTHLAREVRGLCQQRADEELGEEGGSRKRRT
jgi:hypothetical protein